MTARNLQNELTKAELLKIDSEIAKNKAEEKKFLSEANEIEKRQSLGFWKKDLLIKALIGGIVAAALLAAWIIEYMKPILQKSQELSTLENKILAFKNEENSRKIHEDSLALNTLQEKTENSIKAFNSIRDTLEAKKNESERLIRGLKERLDGTIGNYQRLSKEKNITQAERDRYANLANHAKVESEKLKSELLKLRSIRITPEVSSEKVLPETSLNWLYGHFWKVEIYHNNEIEIVSWAFIPGGTIAGKENDVTWEIRGNKVFIDRRGDKYMFNIPSERTTIISGIATSISPNSETWTWKMERGLPII